MMAPKWPTTTPRPAKLPTPTCPTAVATTTAACPIVRPLMRTPMLLHVAWPMSVAVPVRMAKTGPMVAPGPIMTRMVPLLPPCISLTLTPTILARAVLHRRVALVRAGVAGVRPMRRAARALRRRRRGPARAGVVTVRVPRRRRRRWRVPGGCKPSGLGLVLYAAMLLCV